MAYAGLNAAVSDVVLEDDWTPGDRALHVSVVPLVFSRIG